MIAVVLFYFFFSERHFKEWDFKRCHCTFSEYRKFLNFSQLNRTKANLGSCLLRDSNNTSLDDGIKSRASTEGTELSSGSLPGGGGTARWGFHCSFALGHALLFQLNLWCTESLVLFFCHLTLMARSLFLREITLGSENHSPRSSLPRSLPWKI